MKIHRTKKLILKKEKNSHAVFSMKTGTFQTKRNKKPTRLNKSRLLGRFLHTYPEDGMGEILLQFLSLWACWSTRNLLDPPSHPFISAFWKKARYLSCGHFFLIHASALVGVQKVGHVKFVERVAVLVIGRTVQGIVISSANRISVSRSAMENRRLFIPFEQNFVVSYPGFDCFCQGASSGPFVVKFWKEPWGHDTPSHTPTAWRSDGWAVVHAWWAGPPHTCSPNRFHVYLCISEIKCQFRCGKVDTPLIFHGRRWVAYDTHGGTQKPGTPWQ